jgi:hypothetical protein
VWCSVLKPLHVYQRFYIPVEKKIVPPDQGWEVLHHQSRDSLLSANQSKRFISSSKKYVFLFLRENHSWEELIRVKVGFVNKKKQLELL